MPADAARRSALRRRWLFDLGPLWLATLGAIGYFLWVCWTQFLSARFGFFDVGHIDSVIFHAFDPERPFHTQHHNYNHFGCHFTPFFYPLALLRLLFPHPFLLVGLGNASLALGGAGAWLLARRATGSRWIAWAFALLYWRNSFVGSVALANHFESYWIGPAMLALCFHQARRWRWFWAWWIAGLCVKEDIAVYTVVLGVWTAWLDPRGAPDESRRHGRALVAVGLVWGLVAGGTMTAIIRGAGVHYQYGPRYWPPSIHLATAGPLAFALLASVGFLALAAPRALLLAIPPAMVCFLSKHELQRDMLYYYAYGTLPFLFFAAALGAGNVAAFARRQGRGKIARGALAALMLAVAAWQHFVPTRSDGALHRPFAVSDRHREARYIGESAFPRDARVSAQEHLYCFAPQREGLAPLTPVAGGQARVEFEPGLFEQAEWVWLDFETPAYNLPPDEARKIVETLQAEIARGEARVAYERDGFLVVERTARRGGSSAPPPTPVERP